MKITIILPAYNESEGVHQTATALNAALEKLRQTYEVQTIFVNDGSKDNTEALLKEIYDGEPSVEVISYPVNKGMGGALRTGFAHATGDYIVTTDFDGTYSFDNIAVILKQIQDDGTDIVTASPYHPKGHVDGVPPYRLLFSFGASLLYRILLKWHIHTWTAVFRVYKREVIEKVPVESSDFLINTEIMVNAIRAGYTVSEFPTTLKTRSFGQSSIKVARLTLRHLKFQWQLILLKLTGRFKLK